MGSPYRTFIKVLLLGLFFLVVLTPFWLMKDNLQTFSGSDLLFLIHRFLGLMAFSLIFTQIIMGSGRPILSRFFPSGQILKKHMLLGKLAFALALSHPILLFATILTEQNLSYITPFITGDSLLFYLLGVLAAILMIVSVCAAIFRLQIGPKWIYLHRLNYLIFWLIFFHSTNLGLELHSDFAQNLYWGYAIIVVILTLNKLYLWIKHTKQTPASLESSP